MPQRKIKMLTDMNANTSPARCAFDAPVLLDNATQQNEVLPSNTVLYVHSEQHLLSCHSITSGSCRCHINIRVRAAVIT